jgi:hypothetical protein
MSFDFTQPDRAIIIGNYVEGAFEIDRVIQNFKKYNKQPGIFEQHSIGDYEEVSDYSDIEISEYLTRESTFISTATQAENVEAGYSLSLAYRKLQEFGLTLSVGIDNDWRKMIIVYDPDLKHLHDSEDDLYLQDI